MKINPDNALSLALGVMGLYIATGQKPPEWMVLTSLLVGVVGVTRNAVNLFEETPVNELAGVHCCNDCFKSTIY